MWFDEVVVQVVRRAALEILVLFVFHYKFFYSQLGFEILAFPCNQFLNQESLCERDIEGFVKKQFNVSFPIFQKIQVKKVIIFFSEFHQVNGEYTHIVFRYLRLNSSLHDPITGLTSEIPWNFGKFLIDKQGLVRGFYPPTV